MISVLLKRLAEDYAVPRELLQPIYEWAAKNGDTRRNGPSVPCEIVKSLGSVAGDWPVFTTRTLCIGATVEFTQAQRVVLKELCGGSSVTATGEVADIAPFDGGSEVNAIKLSFHFSPLEKRRVKVGAVWIRDIPKFEEEVAAVQASIDEEKERQKFVKDVKAAAELGLSVAEYREREKTTTKPRSAKKVALTPEQQAEFAKWMDEMMG